MKPSSTDRIEKTVVLRAPRRRVWRALTDPGYEHIIWDIIVERMEPERVFSWRWHPYAVEPGVDYSPEPRTLVVFELTDGPEGTPLSVGDPGFDKVPRA